MIQISIMNRKFYQGTYFEAVRSKKAIWLKKTWLKAGSDDTRRARVEFAQFSADYFKAKSINVFALLLFCFSAYIW